VKNVGNSSRGRCQGVPKMFRAPMYRVHCAVIFAIAQLSCCTISECDGQTDGQTDRQRDGRTSLLLQFQRMHDLLCYRAGKISCLSLSFLGPSPRLPTGALLLDPTGGLPPFARTNKVKNSFILYALNNYI